MGSRCVLNLVLSLSLSHTGHWKFNMAPHGKELSKGVWKNQCYSTSAVLNSSPRPPPLCTFCMFLLSVQTFVIFESKCPAKWTSQDIPPWFQFEANVYVPYKVHWSVWDVNLNCIYLQSVLSHTRPCVKTLRSANPWMNVPKWSKLQRISLLRSREQWTL